MKHIRKCNIYTSVLKMLQLHVWNLFISDEIRAPLPSMSDVHTELTRIIKQKTSRRHTHSHGARARECQIIAAIFRAVRKCVYYSERTQLQQLGAKRIILYTISGGKRVCACIPVLPICVRFKWKLLFYFSSKLNNNFYRFTMKSYRLYSYTWSTWTYGWCTYDLLPSVPSISNRTILSLLFHLYSFILISFESRYNAFPPLQLNDTYDYLYRQQGPVLNYQASS